MNVTIGAYTFGNIDQFKSMQKAVDFVLERYPNLDKSLVEKTLKPIFKNESKPNQSDNTTPKDGDSNTANSTNRSRRDGEKRKGIAQTE